MMGNRYDKYKDSGIAWIGEIPEHWEVKKGKNLFKKEERPVRDNDEIITCFRDGEVTLRSNRRTDGFTNAMKEVGYQGVRRGDLVIHNMDAFAGAIGVSDSDGKSTPVYSVCTPKDEADANVYYYAYLLRSYALGGVIQSLAKGIRERSTDFRYKEFGDLFYQHPTIQEQQSIAAYLDQKCGEIDELITLQEEMITKLQSYKQSVITEAVTKGLDKNVPLKDSGIKWIGKIPEHWEVIKIKNAFNIISGATPKTDNMAYWDGEITWITPADYNTEDKMISSGKRNITLAGLNSCGTSIVPEGSIIFSKRAPIGLVAINVVPLCTNQGCISCIPKPSVNTKYFYYLMSVLTDWFELFGSGTTFKELSTNNFANFILSQPPISEQQSIADYLRSKMQRDRRADFHQATENRETEGIQEIFDFRVRNWKKKSELMPKCYERELKEP